MTSPKSMRIVPELRAAHLARHQNGTPAELLYFEENFDFHGSELVAGIQRVSLAGALSAIWKSAASTLEVPEPLWIRFFPTQMLLTIWFRLTRFFQGRTSTVCTYAMENNSFETLIFGKRSSPALTKVSRIAAGIIGLYIAVSVDRMCFASEASRELYQSLPFVSKVSSIVVPELPAQCQEESSLLQAPPNRALFVGVLEQRKGVLPLLQAWERSERLDPRIQITIAGPGPLDEVVKRWVARSPTTRAYAGHVSHFDVHALMSVHQVLIAPSLPDGRWREQIGLPIKEALAHGLTVVTTKQTGLAPWLEERGHEVVSLGPEHQFVASLSRSITRALSAPLDPRDVLSSLPSRDSRLRSDAWLHAPRGSWFSSQMHTEVVS